MAMIQKNKYTRNWKSINRDMARDNARYSDVPVEIPYEEWPDNVKKHNGPLKPIKAFRCKKFMIQVVEEPNGAVRISVNRTVLNEKYDYVDGITWDDLFNIKNAIGYEFNDCIEIYPAADKLVNVANIRHLFVLPHIHEFNWKKD